MKLNKKLSYSAFMLLLIALIAINSCKRDTLTTPSLNDPQERSQIVNYAKLWFESKYPQSVKLSGKVNIKSINDWYAGLKPDWNSAFVYERGKETLIELPLENAKVAFVPFAKDSSQVNLTNNYARTSYVISKDSLNNLQAWFMVLIADTSYVNGDFTKLALNTYKSRDPRFSGRLLYYDPSGDFLAGWRYEHGVITKTLSVTNDKIDYKPAKQQINVAQVCHSYPVVTTTVTCVTVPNQPQMDCTFTYTTIHVTECFYQDGGGGSGGGGGGGGSGGGGSSGGGGGTFPQPPGPGCPVVGVASLKGLKTNVIGGGDPCPPKKDPCDEKAKVKATQSTKDLSNKNSEVLDKTVNSGAEYGSDVKINTPNNTTDLKSTPITTNGESKAWEGNFTWNSLDGFSIGVSHGHQSAAPSPADVSWIVYNIANADLKASGDMQFYKDNAFSTTTTGNGTYVVTIKDWDAAIAMASEYNRDPSAFNDRYVAIALANQSSSEYALLSLFGNAINLFKAAPGSKDFKPLMIGSDNKVKEIPCP